MISHDIYLLVTYIHTDVIRYLLDVAYKIHLYLIGIVGTIGRATPRKGRFYQRSTTLLVVVDSWVWTLLTIFASRTRGSPDKKIAKALFPASDDADDLGSGADVATAVR
jgi:hypothetical protein